MSSSANRQGKGIENWPVPCRFVIFYLIYHLSMVLLITTLFCCCNMLFINAFVDNLSSKNLKKATVDNFFYLGVLQEMITR